MTPELRSLVYVSAAVEPFDDAALRELLERSRAANARDDITGMLLYRAGRFIQFLEGPPAAIGALVEKIAADPRHTDVTILLDGEAHARAFSQWTMGFEPIAAPQGPVPEGFRDTFDDLERADDGAVMLRAARELTLWFRVRAAQRA